MADISAFTLWAPSLAASVTVLGALTVYWLGERSKRKARRIERRREGAVRVLEAIDKLLRTQRLPRIARAWSTAEIDIMLAQHRLLIEFDRHEIALWIWLEARSRQLAATKSVNAKIDVATAMSGTLTLWLTGRIDWRWFAEQNAKEGNTI